MRSTNIYLWCLQQGVPLVVVWCLYLPETLQELSSRKNKLMGRGGQTVGENTVGSIPGIFHGGVMHCTTSRVVSQGLRGL